MREKVTKRSDRNYNLKKLRPDVREADPPSSPQSCIKDMARYLQYKCRPRFAVPINDFLDPRVGGIQRSIEKPPYLLPSGKPMIPHLLCCQGIGIVHYCLTLS